MPSGKTGVNMSKEELVRALREFSKLNEALSSEEELYEACREMFDAGGIIDKFDPANPAKMAEVLETTEITIPEKPEQTDEELIPKAEPAKDNLGPKAMNSSDMKILLDEYDKHRGKSKEEIATAIEKNPLLKNVRAEDIWAAIEKKIRLEAEALKAGTTTETADEIVDERLVVEIRLKEARTKETISKITDREIEKLAQEIVKIAEEKTNPETSQSNTQDVIGKIRAEPIKEEVAVVAEKIVGVADSEKVVKETRKETTEVLDSMGIGEPNVREESVKIATDITAEKIVNEQIEATVEYVTQEIEEVIQSGKEELPLSPKQKSAIETIIEERVTKKVLEEPTGGLNDHKVLTQEEGSSKTLKTGPTLIKEIEEITGKPLSSDQLAKMEIVVKAANEVAVKVLTQNNDQETGLTTGQDGQEKRLVTNDTEVVDIYRGAKLETEVFDRMVKTGASAEIARDTAKFIRELNFPAGEESTSITQIQAEKVMVRNGFEQGNNTAAVEQARIIKNLIRSPIKVGENVNKIIGLGDKLSGIKGFDKLKNVTLGLKKGEKLVKSLEFVQGLVKFQDKIGQITGGITNPIGYILKIPAVQEFAIQVATRLGGEAVGAMATNIAQFGLQQGVKNIVGQLFTTGSVTAIKAGTTLAAQGAATAAGTAAVDGTVAVIGGATGPPGWVVALVLFAVQIVWTIGKKVFAVVKNKFDDLLAGLNVDSGKLKGFLQENFGKGVGGILDFSIKAGALLVLIPTMIGGAFAAAMTLVTVIVPLAFGILLGMQTLHSSQVSSLVAPKGVGGLTCVKKSDITATGDCYANCNPNTPATDAINVNKSLFVNVAERWRVQGAVNAEKCFYDVVCRAKNAGVNPDFALWAWLHESGASNYCGFKPIEIEDFGIHGAPGVSKNNFTQQADFFMPYVGGHGIEGCVGNPLITAVASGREAYWLAIAAYYLNGDCNPNAKNPVSGATAWDYLAEMQSTWSWISSAEMPSSATISPESCGGGDSTTTEYTDTSGVVWICEGESDIPEGQPGVALPTRDPSIPIPEGCPDGWPLGVKACINQGSFGAYSHRVIEAYDFGGGCLGENIGGEEIRATHDGLAVGGGSEASAYGFFVDVTGKCNGVEFTSRYAHMPKIIIQQNSIVHKGDLLGYVDNSGTFRAPGNEHLHYEFLWRALKMNDWVPEPVPNGCYGWQSCGSVIINE